MICSPQISISPEAHLGGAVHDRELLKAIAQAGEQVLILLPDNEPSLDIPGWKILHTRHHFRYTYEYNFLFAPALLRATKTLPITTLRIHSPSLALLGAYVRRTKQIPTIATLHHVDFSPLQDLLIRKFYKAFDLIFTDSHYSARAIQERYQFDNKKVIVATNGVSSTHQPNKSKKALRHKWGYFNEFICLYLGVLTERKNLPLLILAFSQIQKQAENTRLILVGQGPLERVLKNLAVQNGLTNKIQFINHVSEQEKIELYNLADVFVFPSKLEGFGIAVAEAMACGTPVVVSNASSLPEVVGNAGLMFDPNSEAELITAVLEIKKDKHLREALTSRGIQRVKDNFSWERAARITLTEIEKLKPA